MASYRVDDEARRDPRFILLGKKLGTSRFDALARMGELWAYCTEKQTYFLSPEIIDALTEFTGFFQLLLDPEIGLAESADKGIRIKGTKGRIEWLVKLRKQSKKGGEKTKALWQAKRLAKQGPTPTPEPEPKQGALSLAPVPSLAPSPVPVLSKKTKKEEEGSAGEKNPPTTPIVVESSLNQQIWEAYEDEYKFRYHVTPDRNALVNSQIAQIGKRLGKNGPEIARFYVRHNKAYYVERQHVVGLLLSDAEALSTQWKRNAPVLASQAREVERMQHNANVFERAAARLDKMGENKNG
jgi:hypothetical protein